jgi:hypothetical protein
VIENRRSLRLPSPRLLIFNELQKHVIGRILKTRGVIFGAGDVVEKTKEGRFETAHLLLNGD